MSKAKSKRSTKSMDAESRQQRLISLSMDLVEQRLLDGTASSAETVHFLKLANREQKLKEKELEARSVLIDAKVQSIHRAEDSKVLAEKAIDAMKSYSPTRDY